MTDPALPPPATHHHEWLLVSVDFEDNGRSVSSFDCRGCPSVNVTVA